MSNWRRVDEIITYHGKGVTPKYVDKSSIIVLNQKCIRNNKIDYSFAQYIDDNKIYNEEKFLKIGDILINSTGQGTAGRVALVEYIPENFKIIVDSHILVLRTNNFFESKCLNYSLFSIESTLQKFMDGSTGQGEFDRVRLFNVKVGYSRDISTQQKIASVLSALDDKIELNNKINAELEAMAKMLYDYWFVQFDFPDEDGKPYKSSGGKMVHNNVLKREIPESWGDKSLREICYVNSKQVNSKYEGKYINYLDTSNITKNKLGGISNFHVSRRPSRAQRLVDKDDIIYSTVRPIQQHFGILKMPLEDMVVSTGFTVLSHKQNSKFNDILYMYLSSDEIIIRLQNIAQNRVSSYPSISADDILSLSMPWPLEENSIMLIAEQLGRCHEKIHLNQRQNKELAQLRDWLLPMLMNGQVKIGDNNNVESDAISIAAEPDVCYGNTEHLDIPSNRKGFARQVLAGKVVSVFKDDPNFSNIKFQKVQFLAEHIIEVDLNQNYYYQAAGPYDNAFMKSIYGHFKTQKWFDSQNQRFVPLTKEERIEGYYQGYFAPVQDRLDRFFNLLYQTTEAEAEIIATLYAVWNNRIIQGTTISKNELIEDFYKWSDRKQQYTRDQILVGLKWLRDNNLEPKGFGKLIKKAKGK
ncbi:hypothetical protein G5B30_08575 [Sphingobacterium sp. SGG-5]|uniref:restriction endonuclease subunit S n=1 Tax=Sphingobacterium sp. SGG-5 TaxID=2710881 RepID=UPI0013EC95FC|nr:restriction endonuclease subunit S [Sphingobacterium sp. SGG-5]NGM61969.1 hypothetical protein [Sphingobacterium sp. SGG-5]